jgi:predicted phosphate transport protein (TIGR00153 family)
MPAHTGPARTADTDQERHRPMRLPFIPREEKFFELFIADAENMLAGARMLEQMFRSYGERERLASQLRDAEHRGDQLSHEIGQKVNSTFVTPIDREDIHALISRLDDVIDLIEEIADTCILYGITAPTPEAIELVAIIVKQCEQLHRALTKLSRFKDIQEHWIEVHRLENEGDRIGRMVVANLFNNGRDALEVLKWNKVYGLLEEAIDACEDAANVIEGIVVKHA